ncbi:MAG TPA: hypothetical protein PLV68_17400 [Ilumatobacteraceae bacterium]|nr:hypothetical protein [Ilumatobacteraceae bacterium]
MTSSSTSPSTRDRLLPWIGSLESRGAALTDDLRRPVTTLAGALAAVHDRDADRLLATMTDDVLIRIWGWSTGGQWSYRGDEARAATAAWLATIGAGAVGVRVDIDRFFPGDGFLGFDGTWSRLTSGAGLAESTSRFDPGAEYLVSRRFAFFGTFTRTGISVVDLYWGIHPQIGLSDRSPR